MRKHQAILLVAILSTILVVIGVGRLAWQNLPTKQIASDAETPSTIAFEDVTTSAGINYVGPTWSIAWGDANGDGWQDIFVVNHGTHGNRYPSLYINQGDGTFQDRARALFPYVWRDFHGSAWADVDNDGDQDLFVMAGGSRGIAAQTGKAKTNNSNVLWRQDDSGFHDVAASLNIDDPLGRGRAPLWWDADQDGRLDLILTKAGVNSAQRFVFRQGDTGFEACKNALFPDTEANALTPIVGARLFDSDRLTFLGNTATNTWSWFQPDPICGLTHKSVTKIKRGQIFEVMTGDLLGDLKQDVLLPSSQAMAYATEQNQFIDITDKIGLPRRSPCPRAVVADFDNDMDLDIYMGCTTKVRQLPNRYFQNQGQGSFLEVKTAANAPGSDAGLTDQVTAGDYDNDGFLDLFVTHGKGGKDKPKGPHQLYRNTGNDNNWIGFDLIGTQSPKDAYGARVFLNTGGVTQVRDFTGGFKGGSQNDHRVHFGLKKNAQIDQLIVQWPSGLIEQYTGLEINAYHDITEGPRSSIEGVIVTSRDVVKVHEPVRFLAVTPTNKAQLSSTWDFGDGTKRNSCMACTHTYTAPGTYTITATVVHETQQPLTLMYTLNVENVD